MSFNDLKPIYKEFLLKLAVTLTKDELYQRSKAIMRRQKKKLIRNNSLLQKKRNIIVNQKFKSLKHIFRKTLKGKLNKRLAKAQRRQNTESLISPECRLPESSISTSSYDTRQFRPKLSTNHSNKKQGQRKKSSTELKASHRRDRVSTSEESDFFSMHKGRNKSHLNQNRNSSSGYVSCSECSYDSDTCTCESADKCYCSLGQRNATKKHRGKCKNTLRSSQKPCKHDEEKCYCSWQNTRDSLSLCECDTDSCTDSNKCYCTRGESLTIIEQLRHRGFIPPIESGLTHTHKKLCKNYSNTKSSKSLEYMHNPTEEYYEKLRLKQLEALAKRNSYVGRTRGAFNGDNFALDYELFTISNRNIHNIQSKTVYSKSSNDCGHLPLYKQASLRSVNSSAKFGGKHEGK